MPFCPYCDFQIPLTDATFCPNCGKAIEPGVLPRTTQPIERDTPVQMESGEQWSLQPGEQIEWEKDFKEGLIHRHVVHYWNFGFPL